MYSLEVFTLGSKFKGAPKWQGVEQSKFPLQVFYSGSYRTCAQISSLLAFVVFELIAFKNVQNNNNKMYKNNSLTKLRL